MWRVGAILGVGIWMRSDFYDASVFSVLKDGMRVCWILFLFCLAAASLFGQDKPAELPTVTSFECPKYPSQAKSSRLQGMVLLQVTTDGHSVSGVNLTSGHPLLAPDAIKNVRTWKFADHTPTTFPVKYLYVFNGDFKKDKVTKCDAKMEIPSKVTVSTTMPAF